MSGFFSLHTRLTDDLSSPPPVQQQQQQQTLSSSLISHISSPSSLARAFVHTANRIHSVAFSLCDNDNTIDNGSEDGIANDKHRQQQRFAKEMQAQCLTARKKMAMAESYAAWETAAKALDIAEGNYAWKVDDSTPIARAAGETDYNPQLIAARLGELDQVRATGDVDAMIRVIRTSLSRDLGGIGNADLYRHCHAGTKQLVEQYVESFLATVEAIAHQATTATGFPDSSTKTLSPDTQALQPRLSSLPNSKGAWMPRQLLEELLYARQTFGRSALLLSGGGTFGMSHIGVVKSLFEASLLPRIVSGASAGSIVCAVLCTRTDAEMPQLIRDFPYGDLSVFGDPGPGGDSSFLCHLRLLLTQGTWSDIRHLSRVMRNMMGDLTFQEAYNRTRRILNICVSSAGVYELPRLLNYVTAPNVMIWSAVAASCSVPLVFSAAPLLTKDPNTGAHSHWDPTPQSSWIDGSVDNDLPMTRLSEMFNVNHFIVSQVNPHVAPFLPRDDGNADSAQAKPSRLPAASASMASEWKGMLTSLARDEVLHRLHFLSELGILPNVMTKLRSVLSQRYSGDINILPELSLSDLPLILTNPTSEFMVRVSLLGERATWPKLSRIRDRCAIELALDRAVHRVRAHILFSSRRPGLLTIPTIKTIAPIASAIATGRAQPSNLSIEWPQQKRQRRLSGCSAQQLGLRGWRGLVPGGGDDDILTTDNDTDEEEREVMMRLRHGTASFIHSTLAGRQRHKTRLKRAFRSHVNIGRLPFEHTRHAPITAPINYATNELEKGSEFDFSHPVTSGTVDGDLDRCHVQGAPLVHSLSTEDAEIDALADAKPASVHVETKRRAHGTKHFTLKASRESLAPSVHMLENVEHELR